MLLEQSHLRLVSCDELPGCQTASAAERRNEPEHPGGCSPDWSLRRFHFGWAQQQGAVQRNWEPRNLKQYQESVSLWVRYTGDPPLREIDHETCLLFQASLKGREWRGRPIASNTILKHLTAIQCVLDMAGPKSRVKGHRHGIDKYGLFGFDADGDRREPPFFQKPALFVPTPKPFTLEEIELWLEACETVTTPLIPSIAARDFWRALIVWSYNVGTRIGTTLELKWNMLNGDWIEVPPEIMKGDREGKFWVNRFAREAIDHIRTSDARIFPWPFSYANYRKRCAALIQRSQIAPDRRHGGTHRLRAALLSWLMARNPGVAKLQAGHTSSREIILRHYADPSIVKDLLEELPQPQPSFPSESPFPNKPR